MSPDFKQGAKNSWKKKFQDFLALLGNINLLIQILQQGAVTQHMISFNAININSAMWNACTCNKGAQAHDYLRCNSSLIQYFTRRRNYPSLEKSIASNWVILVFGKYLSKHWYLNVLSHLLMHNTTKRHYQAILALLKADLFKQRHWNALQLKFFIKRGIAAHTIAIHCQWYFAFATALDVGNSWYIRVYRLLI